MKIITLIEDTTSEHNLIAEHGLSFYIETTNHKILADTGASDSTWENAKKLNVDLSKIDTVVLSHGHYDHTGGAMTFAKNYPMAQIYIQKSANGDYYNGDKYIGINKDLFSLSQIHLLNGNFKIDDELSVFTNITGRRHYPQSNLTLSKKIDNKKLQDDFSHEQCLVLESKDEIILISGCAHNGILNILDKFKELYHKEPTIVISGFHMMKKTDYTDNEIQVIKDTALELSNYNTKFFTGHCTGQKAFDIMKSIMGDQLTQIHSGSHII